MRATRMLLAVPGLLLTCYGAWLLLSTQRFAQVREVVVWAVLAVVLHDGVLAPAAVLVGWGVLRLARHATAAAATAVVLLVVGGVSAAAAPVLIGSTAGGKNPTLLDRNYTGGWLALVALVIIATIAVAGAGRAGARSRVRRVDGTRHGGRRRRHRA